MHIIQLTEKEEELLYNKDIKCPKRIHIKNRRLWWVPKHQYDEDNHMYLYTICPKCYREKKEFINDLKYKNIELIPIISDNELTANCDASNFNETYNISLNDNWEIGIYQKNENNIILLNGYLEDNNINIYIDNYPIDIIIGLGMQTIITDNNYYRFYISNLTGLINIFNIYSINNEFILTLSDINKTINVNNNVNEQITITEYNNSFNIRFNSEIYKNYNYNYKLNFIKKDNNFNENDEIDVKQEENYQNCIIEL